MAQIIYYLILGVASLTMLICSAIIRWCKDSKKVSNAQNAKIIAENLLNVFNITHDAMLETEKRQNFTAEDKLEYCLGKVKENCLLQGIDYSKIDLHSIVSYFMEIGNGINKRESKQENITD